MSALLPCPFCGHTPSIWTPAICLGDDETDVDYMQVSCRCGISGPQFRFHDHDRRSANFNATTARTAMAWNTRVPVSPAKATGQSVVQSDNGGGV